MSKPTADYLLNLARRCATEGRRRVGCATFTMPSGTEVSVMYDQIAKTYDVGTPARSHAQGARRAVKPALETLLAA